MVLVAKLSLTSIACNYHFLLNSKQFTKSKISCFDVIVRHCCYEVHMPVGHPVPVSFRSSSSWQKQLIRQNYLVKELTVLLKSRQISHKDDLLMFTPVWDIFRVKVFLLDRNRTHLSSLTTSMCPVPIPTPFPQALFTFPSSSRKVNSCSIMFPQISNPSRTLVLLSALA